MDDETRAAINAARIVTKGSIRTLKTELRVLMELLERLDGLDASPTEERRNGSSRARDNVEVG